MKTLSAALGLFLLNCLLLSGQISVFSHPHILVSPEDRKIVISKIDNNQWAKSIYSEMFNNVRPYVERHVRNPEWILSRYLMNRVPGKRYTNAVSDRSGGKLVGWSGDAPYPTVRVSPHMRAPSTPTGGSYRRPSINELIPYDTSRFMTLLNLETSRMERIDPQSFAGDINGEINDLALDAAIIYWLYGDSRYARFAADLINQWARGAYYQVPIEGPCRTGFLDVQTLGDAAHRSIILAFDFLKPFMEANGYNMTYYESVFEKFASTLAFRGFWNNNWYAAESSTMVFASLSLENADKREYYLSFFLTRDTISGGCGQLALPSTVEKWLTHDGHWKEPGGYHNFPVGNLLLSSHALEKNGYDIFRKFPALFKASYAMLKYSFPNLTVSAFGDTGRASQSAESLEIGILAAIKYEQPELPEMLASMNKLIEGGKYRRENSGFIGLLCYLPEIPSAQTTYSWPRSGTLDFAKFFLQRNGMDPEYGLMYGVQGASYNHNHNNGMAMELYGCGEVMGIDAGTGPNYEHPYHVNYYSQWAAHNTVAAAGASTSVPFSGNAGRKDIGQIELAGMEPSADKPAVSDYCSFTDTRYFDKSTGTSQSRTMGIIRTSEKSGYYIDIYRSDNKISNNYIYHNIGDTVLILNEKREPVSASACEYPVTGKDYPGFRFYTGVRKADSGPGSRIMLFHSGKSVNDEIFMQVILPVRAEGREYYTGKSMRTRTSGRQFSGKKLPLFTMRDRGPSVDRPFIALFEPFAGKDKYSVGSVVSEVLSGPSKASLLKVSNMNGSNQVIFQSVDNKTPLKGDNWSFSGYFGVAGLLGDKLQYLYLGSGSELRYGSLAILPRSAEGSANLEINGSSLIISCNQSTEIRLPLQKVKQAFLISEGKRTKLRVLQNDSGIAFMVPAVMKGVIELLEVEDQSVIKDWENIKSAGDLYSVYPERIKSLFREINLDYPGLRKVKSAVNRGDYVNASEELLVYYKKGKTASHLRKDIPSSSPDNDSNADSIVRNIYTFYNQPFKVPRDLNGHLDWSCKGPTDDIEWAWGLNRHYHIGTLLNAYFKTGNRKYSETIDKDIKDWITSSLPYPAVRSSTEMWRGLEVSFRAKAWSNVFYGLMKSEDLSDATRLLILTSIPEHAHYGRNFHGQNNWLTMELSALATIATSWPEFRESESWLDYSMTAMTKSLKDQVYPDGAQTELTSSYHLVALNNFNLFFDICTQANAPVPDVFRKEIEKMWNYTAYTNKPDGYGLLNNDADLLYNRDRIRKAAGQFGRNDWLYIATNGEEGSRPEGNASIIFPWAGHFIMRSGYEKDAQFAWFDMGPWGSGHQHNDKLHLSVSASGMDFLVDGGRFAYRGDVAATFRRYATGSQSHNVIIPDGKLQAAGPTHASEPVDPGSYSITDEYDYASGSFDSYTGLAGIFSHTRAVMYIKNKFWVVVDRLATDRPREVEALWHWHPGCDIAVNDSNIRAVTSGAMVMLIPVSGPRMRTEVIKGQLEPYPQGWYSREYNIVEKSPSVVQSFSIIENTTVVWIISPMNDEKIVTAYVKGETDNDVVVDVIISGEGKWNLRIPYCKSEDLFYSFSRER